MNTKARIARSIRTHTPYLAWAQAGLTPEEVKSEILGVLRPRFRNGQVLERLPQTVLAHEAIVVASIEASEQSAAALTGLLEEFSGALSRNREACMAALEAWNEAIVRATSEFISLYLMEVDKTDLPIQEMRLEVLRNIGGLLEACVQPHLKAALHLIHVRNGTQVDVAELKARKFGVAVEDFGRLPAFAEFMAPGPWRIKLHHWRNIAQHHTTAIVNGRLVCEYKVEAATRQIEMSREDVLAVARAMQMVLSVLRIARSIFILDNEIELEDESAPAVREEAYLLEFFAAIATQGFEVIDVEVSEEMVHLHVKDVTNQEPKARGLHASQFVVGTWVHYERPVARVTYSGRSGKKCLEATAQGEHCRRVADEEVSFESLADSITFRIF